MQPFMIEEMRTRILAEPTECQAEFASQSSLLVREPIAPRLLERLMRGAAAATYTEDKVEGIGTREIELGRRVGATIGLLLSRPVLLRWLEGVTGKTPLRAVAGQLAQTRANGQDILAWHDDTQVPDRLLAVVLNLSDRPYTGGDFELRETGTANVLRSYRHHQPGSMLIFAVDKRLQHRVTALDSGGPRRVYAGWFQSAPEHADDPLVEQRG